LSARTILNGIQDMKCYVFKVLCSGITINPTNHCRHSVGGSFVSFIVVLEHNEREWL